MEELSKRVACIFNEPFNKDAGIVCSDVTSLLINKKCSIVANKSSPFLSKDHEGKVAFIEDEPISPEHYALASKCGLQFNKIHGNVSRRVVKQIAAIKNSTAVVLWDKPKEDGTVDAINQVFRNVAKLCAVPVLNLARPEIFLLLKIFDYPFKLT